IAARWPLGQGPALAGLQRTLAITLLVRGPPVVAIVTILAIGPPVVAIRRAVVGCRVGYGLARRIVVGADRLATVFSGLRSLRGGKAGQRTEGNDQQGTADAASRHFNLLSCS